MMNWAYHCKVEVDQIAQSLFPGKQKISWLYISVHYTLQDRSSEKNTSL